MLPFCDLRKCKSSALDSGDYKTRRLRWAEHVARMEEGRSALKILTGKPLENTFRKV